MANVRLFLRVFRMRMVLYKKLLYATLQSKRLRYTAVYTRARNDLQVQKHGMCPCWYPKSRLFVDGVCSWSETCITIGCMLLKDVWNLLLYQRYCYWFSNWKQAYLDHYWSIVFQWLGRQEDLCKRLVSDDKAPRRVASL